MIWVVDTNELKIIVPVCVCVRGWGGGAGVELLFSYRSYSGTCKQHEKLKKSMRIHGVWIELKLGMRYVVSLLSLTSVIGRIIHSQQKYPGTIIWNMDLWNKLLSEVYQKYVMLSWNIRNCQWLDFSVNVDFWVIWWYAVFLDSLYTVCRNRILNCMLLRKVCYFCGNGFSLQC
jgi:hypothetical protein